MVLKTAERQSLITVQGVAGYWQTRTGGEGTAAASKEFDGGSLTAEIITGNIEYSDVVVTRMWDDQVDGRLFPWLLTMQGRLVAWISDAQTDANLVPTGDVLQFLGTLIKVTPPQANTNSNAAKKISLTFAISQVA